MPLGGIKCCLVKVCFEVAPERMECFCDERKGVPNSWSSCSKRAGTKGEVSAGGL